MNKLIEKNAPKDPQAIADAIEEIEERAVRALALHVQEHGALRTISRVADLCDSLATFCASMRDRRNVHGITGLAREYVIVSKSSGSTHEEHLEIVDLFHEVVETICAGGTEVERIGEAVHMALRGEWQQCAEAYVAAAFLVADSEAALWIASVPKPAAESAPEAQPEIVAAALAKAREIVGGAPLEPGVVLRRSGIVTAEERMAGRVEYPELRGEVLLVPHGRSVERIADIERLAATWFLIREAGHSLMSVSPDTAKEVMRQAFGAALDLVEFEDLEIDDTTGESVTV